MKERNAALEKTKRKESLLNQMQLKKKGSENLLICCNISGQSRKNSMKLEEENVKASF